MVGKGATMKRFLLSAALGIAALVAHWPAAHADEGLKCMSAEDIQGQAEVGSVRHGGRSLRLDGADAALFLDYLNNRIGDPTDYKADTLIVGLYPDLGYVLVAFIVDGCADQRALVRLDPSSFVRAYRAARGVPA